MALTISTVATPQNQPTVMGNFRVGIYDLTFDNSYPTGGESFVAADIGFTTISYVSHKPVLSGFGIEYDYTAGAFVVYDEGAVADAPLTELVNASGDMSTLALRVMVFGS